MAETTVNIFRGDIDVIGSSYVNVVSERTLDAGVTVDGLKIKDAGFSLGGDASGDLYYATSGGLARLPIGTSGQFLSVGNGVPEWKTAGSGDAVVFTAVKSGHGFTSGDVADHIPLTYNLTKAKADSASTVDTVGVLVGVAGDVLSIQQIGRLSWTGHGFSGPAVFVSDVTAGVLTDTPPTAIGSFQKALLKVLDVDTVQVVDYAAEEIGVSLSGENGYLAPPSGGFTPTTSGTLGQWSYTGGYYYRCVASNTWIRVQAETTW